MAAELLKHAEELVKYRIHPTSIISGYRLACRCVSVCVLVQYCIHPHSLTAVCVWGRGWGEKAKAMSCFCNGSVAVGLGLAT